MKKAIRTTFQVLLFFSLLFAGNWVYVRLLEDPFFQVREVEIVGCRKIEQETLRSLALKEGVANLFTLRLKEVATRIESHPWIDHVMARKVFPNKIVIQVVERKPIAILQLDELYYIDAEGTIFSSVENGDGYNYPFLTGLTRHALEREPEETKDLLTKALEFLRISEKEKISPLKEVSEIHMEKPFGIECFTKAEGIGVRLGKDNFAEKLRRLSVIWSDLQKRGYAPMSIDCSDLNRIVVKKSLREKGPGRG